MSYRQRWESNRPGYLLFLLDQSGSMSDPFQGEQMGAGQRKCDMVATVLNSFLNELIVTNTIAQRDGSTVVKPRAEISVIGYEGSFVGSALTGALKDKEVVTLAELQLNPLDIERRAKKEMDETGQIIEFLVPFPIWVKPMAGGGTPMCAALHKACTLAQKWVQQHPDNYPPVIINVTDGMATDGDATKIVREIERITTRDGQALLFNVHLTDLEYSPVYYPASERELPNDRFARSLFKMSSIVPETSRDLLQQTMYNKSIQTTTRGMIFNGDAASIRHMFVFATIPATRPLDLDR